ncbi:hypothetical protein BCR44DRAFT_47018 [Catenaria anguillulae PL171]|uniref:Uncharacterized protein n=1 Tax=Catenaria anguillulae PL171 TaxID=765915 RepID=A0A1Y2HLT0_9FUNG|nr:hypothetical protein BCR44DRAFT_47018 [Catenaria anguillulae PL171]
MKTILAFALLAIVVVLAQAARDPEQPIDLPATFQLGHPLRRLTLQRDGSFTLTSPFKCIRAPCPQAGGQGGWLFNLDAQTIMLFQMIDEQSQWSVQQTWQLAGGRKTADLNARVLRGNKLVAHVGNRSDEFPVAKGMTTWLRVSDKNQKPGQGPVQQN